MLEAVVMIGVREAGVMGLDSHKSSMKPGTDFLSPNGP